MWKSNNIPSYMYIHGQVFYCQLLQTIYLGYQESIWINHRYFYRLRISIGSIKVTDIHELFKLY